MWVDAGFSPDAFWHQSPATFQLAMEGVRKRLEREAEADVRLAWQVAAMSAAAQAGKLKPLRHYLAKQPGQQTPAQMLAALREFQARGARMKIERVRLN